MFHLPQVYSLNSSKARGWFRAAQKPRTNPGSQPSIKATELYFHPWDTSFLKSSPCCTRTQDFSHWALVRSTCQTLPGDPTKQNPSELGMAALVMLHHRAAPSPECCGALRAELLLLWCTRAMREGKSCKATLKCHVSGLQKHKEEIIQRLFLKGAYSFHLWKETVWKGSEIFFKCFSAHVAGLKCNFNTVVCNLFFPFLNRDLWLLFP